MVIALSDYQFQTVLPRGPVREVITLSRYFATSNSTNAAVFAESSDGFINTQFPGKKAPYHMLVILYK